MDMIASLTYFHRCSTLNLRIFQVLALYLGISVSSAASLALCFAAATSCQKSRFQPAEIKQRIALGVKSLEVVLQVQRLTNIHHTSSLQGFFAPECHVPSVVFVLASALRTALPREIDKVHVLLDSCN